VPAPTAVRAMTCIDLPLLLATSCIAGTAMAADLAVQVRTATGEPLAAAAVVLTTTGTAAAALAPASMSQQERRFDPSALIVSPGTAVSFPNLDSVRHHVYSFSAAKRFELRLYAGTPPQPVVFDTPGVVVLGCNIHDWMAATIYVVAEPQRALTDGRGVAVFAGLPPGEYPVRVLHPRLAAPLEATGRVAAGSSALELTAAISGAGAMPGKAATTPLEERFKRFRTPAE
jgi:plastocyanin